MALTFKKTNMAEIEDSWKRLQEHCTGHVFSTFQWVKAWSEAYGKKISILALEDNDVIHAVLPLYRTGFCTRHAGHRMNDINGPLTRGMTLSEAQKVMLQANGIRLYELRHIPRETADILGHKGRSTTGIPYLAINGDFDSFYESRSKKLRSNIRNAERKIEKAYGSYVLEHVTEGIQNYIQQFAEIHATKKDRGMKDLYEDSRFTAFVENLASNMNGTGMMKVLVLKIGGRLAGYKITFIFNGNIYFWNTAFHPDFSKFRCGEIMYREEIRYAFEKSLDRVFMGRGTGYNKTVWADNIFEIRNLKYLGK